MKKINKDYLTVYVIITIITCIVFLPFLLGHYSTDSYNIANIGYYDYAIKYSLNDGRIFMAILSLLANIIKIPIDVYIIITLISSILISNISVVVLSNIIKKFKRPQNIFQEIIVVIISYITIFNFAYLENMYFIECIVMSISILLFLVSANILVDKQNKYFIKSLLLAILAVMFYQGTIGIFFTYAFLFIILKDKNNIKQIIIDTIKCGIIGIIAVLINLVLIKVVGTILQMDQTRLGSLSDIPANMIFIIKNLPYVLKENFGLFPKNFLFIFLAILIIINYIYESKNKVNIIFKFLVIVLVTIASSFILNLTSLTSYYAGRTKNGIGALIGVIFIFIYVVTDIFQNKGKLNKVTILTLLVFSIINIVNYERIILIHKNINELERKEAQELENYILEYEAETGKKVNKIMKIQIYHNNGKAYFPKIKNKSIFAHNAMRCYWSADGFINFYTKRNMKTIGLNKEIMNYYEQKYDDKRGYGCIDDVLCVNTYLV